MVASSSSPDRRSKTEDAHRADVALLVKPEGPTTESAAAPSVIVLDNARLRPAGSRRILVLKLDHLGDFIIGRPALHALREAFPSDSIRLVCGRWNRATAEASGLFDDVRAYDFFPEQTSRWDGKPAQPLALFDEAAEGGFDVAIDLRVDGDTRHLLERVDAKIRCGIGSRLRFGFLDVILPMESKLPIRRGFEESRSLTLSVDRFSSRMRRQSVLLHESDEHIVNKHLIYGPYVHLPRGRYRATFGLHLKGLYGWPKSTIKIDVARDNVAVARMRLGRKDLSSGKVLPSLDFEVDRDIHDDQVDKYEFRVHVSGLSLFGALQFSGVRVDQVDVQPGARYNKMELHIGEQLSLLVELIKQRVLFDPRRASGAEKPPTPGGALERVSKLPPGKTIMIAPLSNKAKLIALILETMDANVVLLGAPNQSAAVEGMVADNQNHRRLLNLVGKTTWAELGPLLEAADLVICNNSGIAHQAAELGRPTLALYSASHPPSEWGPRGSRVRTLMLDVPCSPCGYDDISECEFDYRCMRQLMPEVVASNIEAMLAE